MAKCNNPALLRFACLPWKIRKKTKETPCGIHTVRCFLRKIGSACSRLLCITAARTLCTPAVAHDVSDSDFSALIFRSLKLPSKSREPRCAWVENMDTINEKKIGMIELHPEIFAAQPRIDIVHQNCQWQRMYRFVDYSHTKTRAEVRGGGRKPWPQKGLGRARHGSIRSPLWRGGGIAHGPRMPTSHFFMLPFYTRVHGLTSMLSIKLAQDDLHVVDSLEIPTNDSNFIQDLIEDRNWGPSVLIIDVSDIMPKNITLATDSIKHINLMPVYGLNVYSMLKHSTLVLTVSAVEEIEEKLLYHLHRNDSFHAGKPFKLGYWS